MSCSLGNSAGTSGRVNGRGTLSQIAGIVMAAENRRTTDHEIERIWGAIGDLRDLLSSTVQTVQTHAAVCTNDKERQEEYQDKTSASLDRLVRAADEREMAGRLIRLAAKWTAGGATVIGTIWAAIEHVWPLVVRLATKGAVVPAILLASAALAAPPEGATTSGPVHEWFQKPEVQACCSAADCRPHRVRPVSAGWEVETEAGWLPVPEVAIKKEPSPTFQTIVCIPSVTGVPLCLFWGGGV